MDLWIVPHGYNVMQRKYNMHHTPHVTLPPDIYPSPLVGAEFELEFTGKMKNYSHGRVGFECTVPALKITGHMTVWYDASNPCPVANPPNSPTMGIVCVFDKNKQKIVLP